MNGNTFISPISWSSKKAYSFPICGNDGGIFAFDLCHLTINPCILRILNPNLWSNDDVHRCSLNQSQQGKKKCYC